MKKRKSILCLIMSLTMMLCGCGAAANVNDALQDASEDNAATEIPGGDISLKLWCAEEDAALMDQIVAGFKNEYGGSANFTINIEYQSESNCRDLILDNINEAPDVFAFADDQLSAMAGAGVLKQISYNSEDVKSRNSEGSVGAASVNGNLYAYPLTADNGYFMFYNKSYFNPEDLATLDGMMAVAASNGKKITMDCSSGWYLYSFFGNTGLEVGLAEDGITNFCTWNGTDGAIKGTDVAYALMDIGSNPGFMNGNDAALVEGATNGSVIAGVSGVWLATQLMDIWGDDYAAVKLPTYTVAGQQVQMSSYAGYKLIGVNSYSDNVYWSEVLADWITSEANQTLRFSMRAQGPSNKVAASSADVAASPAIVALIQQSDFSSLQRVGSNYWGPAGEFGLNMISHNDLGMELQEYLDKMVEDITKEN